MRRLVMFWVLIAVGLVACGDGVPAMSTWEAQTWDPLVAAIPQPTGASTTSCQDALSRLRELSTTLRPAPDPDVGDAAEGWLQRAETLVFECASSNNDSDYLEGYEELTRLEEEVRSLIASGP